MIRGDRVRVRRLMLHMSQHDLAGLTHTDQKRISKYENSESDATGDTLASLARILETSVDYLLGLTDDPTPALQRNDLSQDEREVISALRRGDLTEAARVIFNR